MNLRLSDILDTENQVLVRVVRKVIDALNSLPERYHCSAQKNAIAHLRHTVNYLTELPNQMVQIDKELEEAERKRREFLADQEQKRLAKLAASKRIDGELVSSTPPIE